MKNKINTMEINLKIKSFKKIQKFKGLNNTSKSFYYTVLASLLVIMFFSITPKILVLTNDLLVRSVEIENESKNNFEKVLSGQSIEVEQEDKFDNIQVFEDIFQYEDIPTSSVRLSASTIKQLFKDTKYNLTKSII